uniref:helicase-related protein n=1 Tax=Paenibacillus pinistramenti TaxID=1768003 RepID=UPI001EEFBD15
ARSSGLCSSDLTAAARPAPTGQELDRWGLSPAQREAAAAALQFLAGASLSPRRPARPWHASRLRQAASSQLPASPCGPPSTKQSAPYRRSALHRSPAFPWRLNPWRPFRSERSAPHRHFSSSGRPAQPDLPAPSHPAAGRPGRFLLWAVTGAGKTEMIFPLLAYVLQAGGRALVATPRRDVVLELAPRLAKVFPEERMSVLYGGSEDRWKTGNLVLATTHQLLRFRGAFDLVIIDELDAFPYHNDPMLAYAAEACCKDKGHFIFLSATPPRRLQQDASAGRCGVARVPARFHGHPLPVPRRIQTPGTAESISRQRLPGILLSELQVSVRRGAQIFLFISRIQQIEPLLALLRRRLPGIPIEGTSSQDNQRSSKVLAFRSCQIRILVTTTILERGVTVPRSDVFILDADNGLFDEASLVQMAGRAGRSKEDPAGKVIFFSSQSTSAQRGAIRQINQMNRIAYRKGYLGAAKP